MELARAFKHTVEGAEDFWRGQAPRARRGERKVGEAVDKVAKEKGITAETRDKIMEQLGVIRRGGHELGARSDLLLRRLL